jgi:23S rRNA (cytosine1962-C5)-methyltransferase
MQIILDRLELLSEKITANADVDSYRVFHGRGRCFPGFEFVTVDYFQPVILVTLFFEPPQDWLTQLVAQTKPFFSSTQSVFIVQRRYIPNAPSEILWGELPDVVLARRGKSLFNLHVTHSKTPVSFWIWNLVGSGLSSMRRISGCSTFLLIPVHFR